MKANTVLSKLHGPIYGDSPSEEEADTTKTAGKVILKDLWTTY